MTEGGNQQIFWRLGPRIEPGTSQSKFLTTQQPLMESPYHSTVSSLRYSVSGIIIESFMLREPDIGIIGVKLPRIPLTYNVFPQNRLSAIAFL